MSLLHQIGRAGQGIGAGWDDGDVERVWQGLRRKRRRRAVAAAAGLASVVGVVAATVFAFRAGGAFLGRDWREGARRAATAEARPAEARPEEARLPTPGLPRASSSPGAPERALRLTDGSTAAPWGAGAEPGALAIREDSPQRVRLELARGGARFDVVHRPGRLFSVRAGEVTISVLGTAFSVERVADRVGVVVTRGAVMVDWRIGSRRLGAGEEGWFPPLVVAPRSADARPVPVPNDVRRARREPARSPGPGKTALPVARELVRREADTLAGSREEPPSVASPLESPAVATAQAGASLGIGGPPRDESASGGPEAGLNRRAEGEGKVVPTVVPEEETGAGALLADADRARLARRFEEGASLLRRLVRDYPTDQRAPLAAFSLGRLLLGELGRPTAAARAFARARALAPEGPLAEDALAREVEAWARARHPDQARARAAEYLRSYPNGRRAADVNEAVGKAAASASP